MGAAEKVQWYQKQQDRTGKRKFDDFRYEDISQKSKELEDNEVDHYKPWSIFLRDGLNSGKTFSDLQATWKQLVEAGV